MNKDNLLALAIVGISFWASAITVEVAPGESEAVKIAAENLRRDIAKGCPGHETDTRRIVVKTSGKGDWESSVRTYKNGVWTIEGADRRGTVYGIYAISEESRPRPPRGSVKVNLYEIVV